MTETEIKAQKAKDDMMKKEQAEAEQEQHESEVMKEFFKQAMAEVMDEHDQKVTKEKIMAIKSPIERQKLIKEHPDLFK